MQSKIVVWIIHIQNVKYEGPNKARPDSKPHIILVLADDLGWNEVSWHNRRIKTPHLEVRFCLGSEFQIYSKCYDYRNYPEWE